MSRTLEEFINDLPKEQQERINKLSNKLISEENNRRKNIMKSICEILENDEMSFSDKEFDYLGNIFFSKSLDYGNNNKAKSLYFLYEFFICLRDERGTFEQMVLESCSNTFRKFKEINDIL